GALPALQAQRGHLRDPEPLEDPRVLLLAQLRALARGGDDDDPRRGTAGERDEPLQDGVVGLRVALGAADDQQLAVVRGGPWATPASRHRTSQQRGVSPSCDDLPLLAG